MKNTPIFGALLVLSCAAFCSAQGQDPEQLSAPTQVVSYPDAFVDGESIPIWSQGYLIAYIYQTLATPARPNLRVFDRRGNLVSETRLWIEGASFVQINDASASPDGRLAVVGAAIDASGSLAAFFADIPLNRQRPIRIVDTSPFAGRSVAFAPDGSAWVLGGQSGSSPVLRATPDPDHFIVRHLGQDGSLIGEYLPRSTIPCAGHPASGGLEKILASKDRIGIFSYNCDYWVELKPDGDVIGKWHWSRKVPGGDGENKAARRVHSVALTNQGELYATIQGQGGSSRSTGLFRLDRAKSEWVPVNTAASQDAGVPVGALRGVEDNKLVYMSTGSRLIWATLSPYTPAH